MIKQFLMHGGERKNHKYIARVKTKNSDRWRYFYDEKAYRRFLIQKKDGGPTESVEQRYIDDSLLESIRTKYDDNGDSESYTRESFDYDVNYQLQGKSVTTNKFVKEMIDGELKSVSYANIDYYTLNKGKDAVNGLWKQTDNKKMRITTTTTFKGSN